MTLLFKIVRLHGAPKSTHNCHSFVIADSEEAVLDHLMCVEGYNEWSDFDGEGPWVAYDDDYKIVATYDSYREYLLHRRGRIHDDDYLDGAWGDAYYGVEASGWEPPVDVDLAAGPLSVLVAAGILEDWRSVSV